MAQSDLNLIDFWLIVKKRKALILFTMALVSVFTAIMPYLVGPEPTFKTSARVRYERSTTATGLLQETVSVSEGNDIATQAEVIRSFPVMKRVARQLGLIAQTLDAQTMEKAIDEKSIQQSPEFLNVIYGLQSKI